MTQQTEPEAIQPEFQTMDVVALIRRFENDIVYDAHGYTAKFERSHARRELQRRGRDVLRPIIGHLLANDPSGDLRCAWGHLLNHIEIGIDPEKTGPQSRTDTPGWIAWAEKFAEPV